ncbi:MAG TPA: pyridoxamine 5'-phosphate oxidase family protein [Myxococcaceae bacterium]|jgi:PPOX class probable F420-dependent enzyme
MDERVTAFVDQHSSAAMVTLRADGTPHTARVGVGVVDGKIWSSGTQSRLRTRHLRRDPRAGLFVFDTSPSAQWLGLDTEVTILDGPDAPELNFRLMRQMQKGSAPEGKVVWFGGIISEEEFLAQMRAEQRLVYEFDVKRAYGYY